MAPAPPKAFISHASEDKVRFVLGFATKLREKGIDAWLDRWEIKPGDSLAEISWLRSDFRFFSRRA